MDRRRTRKFGESGFTILESLIAIMILAFGLMAVVTMIDVSRSTGTLSKNTTKALELATWMMDKIRFETSLTTQTFSTDRTKLLSFDNDGTGNVVLDTNAAADPANEPGKSTCQQWRALLQGLAVPTQGGINYLGANALLGNFLSQARGTVSIKTFDPDHGNNHYIVVTVSWQEVLPHHVTVTSVLAAAE